MNGIDISRIFIVRIPSKEIELDNEILYRKLCRIIVSALMLSYSIRSDTAVCICIDNKVIEAFGNSIKRLYADESSCIGLIKTLFKKKTLAGLRISNNCALEKSCKTIYNIYQLLEGEYKELETPLCIELSVKNDYLMIRNTKIKFWYGIVIANIELDNIGI